MLLFGGFTFCALIERGVGWVFNLSNLRARVFSSRVFNSVSLPSCSSVSAVFSVSTCNLSRRVSNSFILLLIVAKMSV